MAAGTPLSPSLLFSKMKVKGYLSHGVTEARQWDEVVKRSLSSLEIIKCLVKFGLLV